MSNTTKKKKAAKPAADDLEARLARIEEHLAECSQDFRRRLRR